MKRRRSRFSDSRTGGASLLWPKQRGPSVRFVATAQPIGDNPAMSPFGYGLAIGFNLYLLLAASGHWQFGMLVWFVSSSIGGWMEHRNERPPPPGHCRQCRYDVTGNVSGRCPECGTRT